MSLQPIERKSLADKVFEQLSAGIVRGEFSPGAALPSERKLCEVLGVNRGAVREALQRLSQAGLIAVRQGETTKVRDFRRDGGLDLLARILYRSDGSIDLQVARSTLEMRQVLGPEIARKFSLRANEVQRETLQAIAAEMEETQSLAKLQELGMRLWDCLVEGSGNIAYRLAYNTLKHVYDPIRQLLAQVLAPELTDRDNHHRLLLAVTRKDGEETYAAANDLIAKGNRAMLTALEAWEETSDSGAQGHRP